MIRGKKVVVVMPAYNAGKTLRTTCAEVPMDIVDEIILVDDASRDETVAVARELGLRTIVHPKNRGYGGNQKSCYKTALEAGADIVIMLHPDYQYTPKLVSAMAYILESGLYEVVLGSRILGGQARKGGMPLYKYVSNRFLTWAQNLLMGAKLSEYHTGYRAFTRKVLETVHLEHNSDDFVFDNQMLSQIHFLGIPIAEVTCPAKYFEEASSISFIRSMRYGLGCLWTALQFRLTKFGLRKFKLFTSQERLPRLIAWQRPADYGKSKAA
jgi:glycosyltransferase involved in cell wall biosynthesis